MKRIKEFLKKKSNWPNLIILTLAIIGCAIGFFRKDFSHEIIAAMFMLIAVQLFISRIICFEKLEKKLDDLRSIPKDAIIVKQEDNFMEEINKLLRKAQKEIIITGGALSLLSGDTQTEIFNASSKRGLKVRLLAVNIDNKNILNGYNTWVDQRLGGPASLDHLKTYNNKDNIEIRTFEFLPAAIFVAIDLDEHSGYIKVHHILSGVREKNMQPFIEINPSNRYWYGVYSNYIKTLWDCGKKWRDSESAILGLKEFAEKFQERIKNIDC